MPFLQRAFATLWDDEEQTIDIGDKQKPAYRGSLVVIPTPIGNLGDLSLRQFEALSTCDILACEDTRKTGKLLELILQKRTKDRFRTHFGRDFDSFYDGEQEPFEADVGDAETTTPEPAPNSEHTDPK